MSEQLGNFRALLTQLGMNPVQTDFNLIYPSHFLPVVLDGMVMGYLEPKLANNFVKSLRAIKIQ